MQNKSEAATPSGPLTIEEQVEKRYGHLSKNNRKRIVAYALAEPATESDSRQRRRALARQQARL